MKEYTIIRLEMPWGAIWIMSMIAILIASGFILGCFHGSSVERKKREDELFK